jgi:fumarate hydratase class II
MRTITILSRASAAAKKAPGRTMAEPVPRTYLWIITATRRAIVTFYRIETDSLGEVRVPADKLWGAQTQRSLEYFAIGDDLVPREMIEAYAILKKAAAIVNAEGGQLAVDKKNLIVTACDEILAGRHRDMFPLHIWMTGSGTQFNMNMNEVIANRCSELAGRPLGSKSPVHPNDDANMSQSTNDTFPAAMYMAAAIGTVGSLLPSLESLRDALDHKAKAWADIVKIGRTHLQDATPLTLGQEFSGYVGMLDDAAERIGQALGGVHRLALGGTAVGTGLNAPPGFDRAVAAKIAVLTGLPFVSAPNKFAVQGAHDALVHLSGTFEILAVSLRKIADDVRLLACGPRAGLSELVLPENEPGSSIMPGKVNPTQCEALTMITIQVMANHLAVVMGGAGGHLEMNAYKPLLVHNVMHAIRLLTDGMSSFRKFLVVGMEPNRRRIAELVERSLMLVTALAPRIGYDRAAQICHIAQHEDLTLREAALKLGYVTSDEFDSLVDPERMVGPFPGPA